jgi:hypothetical protein
MLDVHFKVFIKNGQKLWCSGFRDFKNFIQSHRQIKFYITLKEYTRIYGTYKSRTFCQFLKDFFHFDLHKSQKKIRVQFSQTFFSKVHV